MAASGLHISIAAEPLFSVGQLVVSNSILTSTIVSALLILFALAVRLSLTNTNKPTGLQNFAEWIVESLWNLVHSITGNTAKTKKFLPWVGTFLLFILLNNWIGLFPGVGTIGMTKEEGKTAKITFSTQTTSIPVDQTYAVTAPVDTHENEVVESGEGEPAVAAEEGDHTEEDAEAEHGPTFIPFLRPGSADLNTTLALALISVFLIQFFGVQSLGLGYFKKYINFSSPIMFFVGILELVSELAKVVSFAFRLFGNVFAGEVLLVVITFLVPLIAPLPFYGLEVFVGFIQALVFAMLSLVFYNMATVSHDEH